MAYSRVAQVVKEAGFAHGVENRLTMAAALINRTTLSGKWALVPESSAAIIDDDGIRFQPFEPLAPES